MPNTQISLRIDAQLKADADAVLDQLGLSTSDFTRMALHQLVLQRGLPFEARIPNAETQAAIAEPREGLKTYANAGAMMGDILNETD